jgi:aspartyl/asparaginyl beta-hydroxylase
MVSHAKLPFQITVEAFQKEVYALTGGWVAHFNYRHYEGEWSALALRSPGGKIDQIIPDQIQQAEYADTALLDACPAIQSWLATFACPLLSARLLNLRANSIIKEHRDHELSFENGEARLHVPIFTNPSVEFYLNNVLLKMNEGECWYINANLPHRVSNLGTTDRIHLVIDCVVNDWLRSLFESGERYYAEINNSDETRRIIRELRYQNTEVSNRLASDLENQLNQHP